MEVLVEHDYVAKEPNELTITKGDIIKDVIKKQGGWSEGTLKDRKGLFPDNFVKVIDKDSTVVLRNRKDASRIRQCRVVFSYKQDHEDELNLNVGDVIDILGEEEEGWWRGLLHGREGVFPSNFVEEIPQKITNSRENISNSTDTAPPLHPKPLKTLCEVKFPYKAQNEDELTLKEGDLITLISRDAQDPGWWKGELNGLVGVFPDNFVRVLEEGEERHRSTHTEPAIKPSTTVSSQRKSLEATNEKTEVGDSALTKTTPPLPGKKPTIPIKKSPSSGSASGGIFYGLKKKLVDVVDGASGSKNISPPKTESSNESYTENAFDDVHRRPLLADVRASRPKAPGRRPPSVIGKDAEPGIMNGSTDHATMEILTESQFITNNNNNNNSSSSIDEPSDNKPKLREWEKHRAPWLEEMKLNQAKRGSNSSPPSTGGENKPKPTTTDNNNTEKTNNIEPPSPPPPLAEEPKTMKEDKTKLIGSRIKTTPTNEFPVIRNKPNVPMTPSRPQTIQNLSDAYLVKQTAPLPPRVSPVVINKTPSPMQKSTTTTTDEAAGGDCVEDGFHQELEQRIARLEELLEQQQQKHEAAIEELRGKLQIETEMRMKLQVKLERLFTTESGIQQL